MAKLPAANLPLKTILPNVEVSAFFQFQGRPLVNGYFCCIIGLLTQPALDKDDRIQTQIKFLLL